MTPELSPTQTAAILRQLDHVLDRSPAFRALTPRERAGIRGHTQRIADILEAPANAPPDPFAVPLADEAPVVPVPPPAHEQNPLGRFTAESAHAGAAATGHFLREVDFPAFVAELVQGTFRAIVEASIEQMRAYAELVQSVVASANEFRDQNVSTDQARDSLLGRYPNLFQINVGDSGPRLGPKGLLDFDQLPDFAADLGLESPLTEFDEDTIEETLVPAARNQLALARQRMLATMVLMGINRIIVTDGRINAKVKFSFTARDKMTRQAFAIDYRNLGTTVVETQGPTSEEPYNPDTSAQTDTSTARRLTTGAYTYVERPEIKVASLSKSESEGGLESGGSIYGEVDIRFKSETFPLERLVDTDQMLRLNQIQGQRGTPAAPGGAPAATAPAAQPGAAS